MSRRIILPPTHLVSKRLSVPYHPWQSPLSVEATHNHDSPIYWDDIKVLALFPLVISFVSFFYFTKDDNTPRFKPPFQPLPFSTSFTNPTIPRPQPPISPPRSTFSTVAISSARGSWCEWSFCFDTDGYVKEERGERVEGEGREGGRGWLGDGLMNCLKGVCLACRLLAVLHTRFFMHGFFLLENEVICFGCCC